MIEIKALDDHEFVLVCAAPSTIENGIIDANDKDCFVDGDTLRFEDFRF